MESNIGSMDFTRILLAVFFLVMKTPETSGLSAEGKLIHKLTAPTQYERFASPNSFNYTTVTFSIYTTKIVDIDDRRQEASLPAYLILEWEDPRLRWNATKHKVDTLLFSSEQIWIPDIGLHNSLDATYDLADKVKYRVSVKSDGIVRWYPGSVFIVACHLDMTNFPFDEQQCTFYFGSWSQSPRNIRMSARGCKINFASGHVENGQWYFVSSSVHAEIYNFPDDPLGWSRVWVDIKIKRRPAFYVMNVIVPCVAISLLVLMVFYIPSESGEKVSLGVNVLLAFSVFQLVMADTLPKSAQTIPIIVIYLTTLMITSALSTVLAVVMLNIHGRPGTTEMPAWLQRFVFNYLTKLVCMERTASEFKMKEETELAKKTSKWMDHVPTVSDGMVTPTMFSSLGEMVGQEANNNNNNNDNNKKRRRSVSMNWTRTAAETNDDAFSQLMREKKWKRLRQELEEKKASLKRQWILASRIIDRFLMIIYLVLYIVLTLTCFVILPNMPRSPV